MTRDWLDEQMDQADLWHEAEEARRDKIAWQNWARLRICTCGGTAPGYPQHEWFCGQPEEDEDDS